MTTDFRALCAELSDALRNAIRVVYHEDGTQHISTAMPILRRARAALADEPAVPEGREPVAVTGQPSDEQLLEVMPQQFHDDLATVSRMAAHGAGPDVGPGLFRVSLNTGVVDFARAVLARWGNPAPQPPAEGEVAELVRMLTGIAHWRRRGRPGEGDPSPFDIRQADRLDRAADLLQRLSPPQPVQVAERLPGPEDCAPWPGEPNAGRWCWMASCVDNGWAWEQRTLGFLASFPQDFTHWLPAHALPLPGQEVEP